MDRARDPFVRGLMINWSLAGERCGLSCPVLSGI